MTRVIDIAPYGRFAYTITVTLGEGAGAPAIRVSMRWLRRIGRWQCMISRPSGETISPPTLVEGGAYVPGVAAELPGRLYWTGPDSYTYSDLGSRLRLLWDEP